MMKPIRLSNKGFALPTVLLVMVIVMILVTAVTSLATTQTKEEIYFENDTSALHAADAGLNKYLWHLNKEGSSIAMNTDTAYPEDHPSGVFKLVSITDDANIKTVKSTGWKINNPKVIEAVEATFQKRSFTQYIYFSDEDPDSIYWSGHENCYGPYHTNTKLSVSGHPNFWGKVTTVQGINPRTNLTADYPIFHAGYEQLTSTIDMPPNNSELMTYGLDSDGYYYEGRTSIRLNANGTVTIWNPNYTPAIVTRPLPANGVIYVNEKNGFNYNDKFDNENGNVFIGGKLNGRLTVAAKHDIYITGYDPTVSTFTSASVTNGVTYKDTTITLNTTTGVITVNETAGNAEADMLGLIADYNVAILTKGWFDGDNINSAVGDFRVYAALMAINGSFINSVFMNGANPSTASPSTPGVLTVRGAIIQNKRGTVGRFNSTTNVTTSGYSKNYAHDTRMNYDAPPHFLSPEGSGWEILSWNEIN